MYGTLENKASSSSDVSGEDNNGRLLQDSVSIAINNLSSNANAGQYLTGPATGGTAQQSQPDLFGQAEQDSQQKKRIYSHCHVQSASEQGDSGGPPEVDKSARRRLILASVICLVFMIAEVVGGVLSNSLAIATDAAHLLTDFASFMISLFAIWLSSRPATRKMSFGWYRAEVIGALLSVLMIWLVTGLLVYMAVERLRTGEFEIDSLVMVITATGGLVVNIIMAIALNVDGHGHGHFHSHGHGGHGHNHDHEHDIRGHSHLVHIDDGEEEGEEELEDDEEGEEEDGEEEDGAEEDGNQLVLNTKNVNLMTQSLTTPQTAKNCDTSNGGVSVMKGCRGLLPSVRSEKTKKNKKNNNKAVAKKKKCPGSDPANARGRGRSNINVRAAFIHVIGDFLQSLGVLIAALVIHFEPSYAIVDPICTFLFSIIVLVTTINIIRDATNVLMEGIPDGINFIEVREKLQSLPNVIRVHNLRIWSLSLDKIAISTHLVIDTSKMTSSQALKQAIDTLKSSYNFFEVTIQIEEYKEDMKDCEHCQDEDVVIKDKVDSNQSLTREEQR